MAADHLLIPSLLPAVSLRVEGDAEAVRHLRAEYLGDVPGNPAESAPRDPAGDESELTVRFVDRLAGGVAVDGHKTVRWAASLERPDPRRLTLSIALRGWPRWFGLSLVQGYLIEPALSLLAVEGSGVLLSTAAVVPDGAALLLVGQSGTGKSSLALRCLAAGIPVLGDDQVVVTADGTCWRFPRRLRIYDDARLTAPAAVAGLSTRYRRDLLARRAVRIATLGYVAPSLAVPAAAISESGLVAAAPLGSVVLLSRQRGMHRLEERQASVSEAVDLCADVSRTQRRRLRRIVGADWADLFAQVEDREREILLQSFDARQVRALQVPDTIGAVRAVEALATHLGLPLGSESSVLR